MNTITVTTSKSKRINVFQWCMLVLLIGTVLVCHIIGGIINYPILLVELVLILFLYSVQIRFLGESRSFLVLSVVTGIVIFLNAPLFWFGHVQFIRDGYYATYIDGSSVYTPTNDLEKRCGNCGITYRSVRAGEEFRVTGYVYHSGFGWSSSNGYVITTGGYISLGQVDIHRAGRGIKLTTPIDLVGAFLLVQEVIDPLKVIPAFLLVKLF